MASDPTVEIVTNLLAALDRDLTGYRSAALEAPNRLLAGRAALHGVETAVNKLLELRATLLDELGGIYGQWDRPDTPVRDAGEAGSR